MMNHTENHLFRPPLPSRATRKIPMRSRASCRGLVALEGQKFAIESLTELRTLLQILSRADVANVWEQPPAVSYRDSRGRIKSHTFDFLITKRCGRKIAVAVKSSFRAKAGRFFEELQVIAQQVPPGFADEVVLVTEKDLSRSATLNAGRCFQAKRMVDPLADEAVAAAISEVKFPTTIENLVRKTGLLGRGYRALLRAIAEGRLLLTESVSVDYASQVILGDG